MGHLKNAELAPKCQKYKGRVVLRGDIVRDDSGAYTVFSEAKMEDAPRLPKIQKSESPEYGYVFHDTNGRNPGETLKIPCYFLNEIYMDTHPQDWIVVWQHSLKKLYWSLDGKSAELECLYFHGKQRLFLSVYVDDIKMAGTSRIWLPCGRK